MESVDGNAIGGALLEHFGIEMTTASGRCGHCGNRAQIAELRVYLRAPGAVARCRKCGGVVLVVIERPERTEVNLHGFELAG